MRSPRPGFNVSTIVFGGGGHARIVLDIARLCGRKVDFLVAETIAQDALFGVPVFSFSDERWLGASQFHFVVAIGENRARDRIFTEATARGGTAVTLIHPFSSVSSYATVGAGTVVCAGAIVCPSARIGDNCILNTGCSVDHDCVVEPHSHICPGARLAGTVHIGSRTMIGTGSSVIPGVSIGQDCVIGAGSTVVSDIPDQSVAYGNPARVRRTSASFPSEP